MHANELQPKLYKLAVKAARGGSEIALEMLVNLPERNGRFMGGWLFDYEFDELFKYDPVDSNRWKFRSAHRIDKPMSAEDKKEALKFQNGIY
jgi:hypothetical protein